MRFAAAAFGVAMLAAAATGAGAGQKRQVKVSLRAVPRVAPAPVTIVFNVELTGGEDGEALYCPVLEWEWGDGTRSVEEAPCPDFETGRTPVQRRFTATHEYRDGVRPRATVTVRKDERVLGRANIGLIIGEPKQPLDSKFRVTGG